jgi:hypothetical protein
LVALQGFAYTSAGRAVFLQLGLHAQFVFRFESRRNMKRYVLPLLCNLRRTKKRKGSPGRALVFGGASGIRTPDLWIMIPSL